MTSPDCRCNSTSLDRRRFHTRFEIAVMLWNTVIRITECTHNDFIPHFVTGKHLWTNILSYAIEISLHDSNLHVYTWAKILYLAWLVITIIILISNIGLVWKLSEAAEARCHPFTHDEIKGKKTHHDQNNPACNTKCVLQCKLSYEQTVNKTCFSWWCHMPIVQ